MLFEQKILFEIKINLNRDFFLIYYQFKALNTFILKIKYNMGECSEKGQKGSQIMGVYILF